MTGQASPWVLSLRALLKDNNKQPLYSKSIGERYFNVYLQADAVWITDGQIAFRAVYSPAADLKIKTQKTGRKGISLSLVSAIGKIQVDIAWPATGILHYQTYLTSTEDLFIPFWPREIVALKSGGKVRVKQEGTRSGLIYAQLSGKDGAFLYFQNLTSLTDYCQQTETSCADVVGGIWPEIGLSLPPALKKPLLKNKQTVISDAYIAFDGASTEKETAVALQYLDLLASVYRQLPVTQTNYQPWPEILDKGLRDLIHNPACWSQVGGHSYLNAYACDYATPPEIMVQLAVLLPLQDFIEWGAHELEAMKKIMDGLPAFYNEALKTIMRWHPLAAEKLKGEEEQKKPMVMDSWYLHHPLLNLSRLALKGERMAKKLFLNSLEFAIKVAHHFKYHWPVFYHMKTLEVIKAETKPGMGSEKDVAGLYAHIMMQAWELTGKKRYLHEAKKAADTLKGYGFDLFYQANNTSFGAGALVRLFKATGKKKYLELSYICLAGIFKNVKLWDCNYGYGRHFPSFFSLFPLNDAPYTAVYEEQEVFCALHEYLVLAADIELPSSIKLLIAEYIRHLVDRAVYYYPPMLPKEVLADEPKIGELNPELWIALEDMQDGWEKCGQVGQEVYGAGNAFGIVPRHYLKVPHHDWMIYCDYPVANYKTHGRKATFDILGDTAFQCRLMIIKAQDKLPEFKSPAFKKVKEGNLECSVAGNQSVVIQW